MLYKLWEAKYSWKHLTLFLGIGTIPIQCLSHHVFTFCFQSDILLVS